MTDSNEGPQETAVAQAGRMALQARKMALVIMKNQAGCSSKGEKP